MHFRAYSLKNSLFSQKNILERSSEINRKFVSLNKIEKEQIQRKIRICCKQSFLLKAVKQDKYKQKNILLLKTSNIQLNYPSLLFCSILGEVHWKILFLVKKVTISERITEILRKLIFLNKFEKAQILRKILICFKQNFLIKPVKGDKY